MSIYSYSEYLALEASSNVKHEFLAGQIYAMPGGTPEHDGHLRSERARRDGRPSRRQSRSHHRGAEPQHRRLRRGRSVRALQDAERALSVWTRGEDNSWRSTIVREGEAARLSIGAQLDVRELYDAAAEPR